MDCIIEKGKDYNEAEACWRMAEKMKGTPIVICDRNYEEFNLFAHLEKAGHFYVIRIKDVTSNGMVTLGGGSWMVQMAKEKSLWTHDLQGSSRKPSRIPLNSIACHRPPLSTSFPKGLLLDVGKRASFRKTSLQDTATRSPSVW